MEKKQKQTLLQKRIRQSVKFTQKPTFQFTKLKKKYPPVNSYQSALTKQAKAVTPTNSFSTKKKELLRKRSSVRLIHPQISLTPTEETNGSSLKDKYSKRITKNQLEALLKEIDKPPDNKENQKVTKYFDSKIGINVFGKARRHQLLMHNFRKSEYKELMVRIKKNENKKKIEQLKQTRRGQIQSRAQKLLSKSQKIKKRGFRKGRGRGKSMDKSEVDSAFHEENINIDDVLYPSKNDFIKSFKGNSSKIGKRPDLASIVNHKKNHRIAAKQAYNRLHYHRNDSLRSNFGSDDNERERSSSSFQYASPSFISVPRPQFGSRLTPMSPFSKLVKQFSRERNDLEEGAEAAPTNEDSTQMSSRRRRKSFSKTPKAVSSTSYQNPRDFKNYRRASTRPQHKEIVTKSGVTIDEKGQTVTASDSTVKICQLISQYSKKLLKNVKKTVKAVYHNNNAVNRETQNILTIPLIDREETFLFKKRLKMLSDAQQTSEKLDEIKVQKEAKNELLRKKLKEERDEMEYRKQRRASIMRLSGGIKALKSSSLRAKKMQNSARKGMSGSPRKVSKEKILRKYSTLLDNTIVTESMDGENQSSSSGIEIQKSGTRQGVSGRGSEVSSQPRGILKESGAPGPQILVNYKELGGAAGRVFDEVQLDAKKRQEILERAAAQFEVRLVQSNLNSLKGKIFLTSKKSKNLQNNFFELYFAQI